MNDTQEGTTAPSLDLAGKYLTFELRDEPYGVEILKVREIVGLMPVTSMPRMPDHIKGVINLRGSVIPVIDLRQKLDMPAGQATAESCIIVVSIGEVETGLIVDRVCEVRDISGDNIEPSPDMGSQARADFVLGVAKTERVILLLDITRILCEDQDLLEEMG
ncbi:MAG: chemotaxis protein CheW [Phycisphaerae bacterium]